MILLFQDQGILPLDRINLAMDFLVTFQALANRQSYMKMTQLDLSSRFLYKIAGESLTLCDMLW